MHRQAALPPDCEANTSEPVDCCHAATPCLLTLFLLLLLLLLQYHEVANWDVLHPFASCPGEQRYGWVGDGGKWTCVPMHKRDTDKAFRNGDCMVYSFGVQVRDQTTAARQADSEAGRQAGGSSSVRCASRCRPPVPRAIECGALPLALRVMTVAMDCTVCGVVSDGLQDKPSYEHVLVDHLGCTVHAFDPTPGLKSPFTR